MTYPNTPLHGCPLSLTERMRAVADGYRALGDQRLAKAAERRAGAETPWGCDPLSERLVVACERVLAERQAQGAG